MKGDVSYQSAVLNYSFSDHLPVVLIINIKHEPQLKPHTYKKLNQRHLSFLFQNESWRDVLGESFSEGVASLLVNKIVTYMSSATKIIKIPSKLRCIKPWITPNVVKCIRTAGAWHHS